MSVSTVKTIAFWAFAIAFAIKVPVWPFHTWLPDAHTEAPTAGSMILADRNVRFDREDDRLLGLCHCICDQGPGLAVPYLAARRPYRSADRRFDDPGRSECPFRP